MSNRIKKIPQLDALRAFAAFSVIFYHFLPAFFLPEFHYGWIGVDIFFVISGYLVTAILLEQKATITDKFSIVKNFIIKRALRLFPTYYIFITVFALLMYFFHLWSWDKGNAIYYYTYTTNILFYLEGWKGIHLNHLWTLAVEEQFYLVWPWLVIFIPNKNLIWLLLVVIPLSFLYKSITDHSVTRTLTICHFDTLGAGALIALLLKQNGEHYFARYSNLKQFLIIPAAGLLIYFSLTNAKPGWLAYAAILILSTSFLLGCYYNFKGVTGKIFQNNQLIYLGKISYGLYLYHCPIPLLLNFGLQYFNVHVNGYILLVFSILLTVLIAHLSYHLLEKRFLKMKEKFDL